MSVDELDNLGGGIKRGEGGSFIYKLNPQKIKGLVAPRNEAGLEEGGRYNENGEPIYQNQKELQMLIDKTEPLYQNLPAHERLLYKQRVLELQRRRQKVKSNLSMTKDGEEGEEGNKRGEVSMIEPMTAEDENTSGTTATMNNGSNGSGSIHVDDSVTSGVIANKVNTASEQQQLQQHQQQLPQNQKGFVSRVSITNSREDLRKNFRVDDMVNTNAEKKVSAAVNADPRKTSVVKINIGEIHSPEIPTPASREMSDNVPKSQRNKTQTLPSNSYRHDALNIRNNNSSNFVNNEFVDKKVGETHPHHEHDSSFIKASLSMEKLNSNGGNPNLSSSNAKTPASSKPRAGRKRWMLNFGNKTGSLKSVKSRHDSGNSSGGGGGLVSSFLNGLSKSKPDLSTSGSMVSPANSFNKGPPPAKMNGDFSLRVPSKMPKEEIGAFLEQKLREGEVLREFENIPKKRTTAGYAHKVSCQPENIPRNRFQDVLPYDDNRIRLFNPDKDNKAGYVNASHVSATVGLEQRFYIAAQGPLPETVLHFWQMILQCDVHLIVMLTDLPSNASAGGNGAIPYWPKALGTTLELGDFQIMKQFATESSDGSYTTSTLRMTHTPSNRRRTIFHLQYADWSDHGCPADAGKFVQFLEEMSSLRNHTASEIPNGRNRNPPVLVHCSAGVGRTGVTILCDILLHCIDHNLDVDIPKVLSHLRQQRMLMVQTIAQYKFVHTVLIKYLKQSRLI